MAIIIRDDQRIVQPMMITDTFSTGVQDTYAYIGPDPIWFDIIDYLGFINRQDGQLKLAETSKALNAHFHSRYAVVLLPDKVIGCNISGSTPQIVMRPLCMCYHGVDLAGNYTLLTDTIIVAGHASDSVKGPNPAIRIVKLTTRALGFSADVDGFTNNNLGIMPNNNIPSINCGVIDTIVDIYPNGSVTDVFEVTRHQIKNDYVCDNNGDGQDNPPCLKDHHIVVQNMGGIPHINNIMDVMIRRMRSRLSTGHSRFRLYSEFVDHLKQIYVKMGLGNCPAEETAGFVDRSASMIISRLSG